MDKYWILVADSARARLFRKKTRHAKIQLLEEFNHPESRQKGKELASDRPGHYLSKGTGHGAFVNPTNLKQYEASVFAKQLANKLVQASNNHAYKQLIIFASPKFYGLLKKRLTKSILNSIKTVIGKDYTKISEHRLPEMISKG